MAYYRQLVSLCVKTLSTFDPNTTSIEDHLVKFLDQEVITLTTSYAYDVWMLQAVEGEREQMFVKEAVAGCVQYRQLIKVSSNDAIGVGNTLVLSEWFHNAYCVKVSCAWSKRSI